MVFSKKVHCVWLLVSFVLVFNIEEWMKSLMDISN